MTKADLPARERGPRRRDLTRAERQQSERNRKAWRTAFDQFPALRCGTGGNPDARTHPCPWLVWSILEMTRTPQPLKRGAVLAHRRRLLLSRKPWLGEDVTVDPVTGLSLVDENDERKVA